MHAFHKLPLPKTAVLNATSLQKTQVPGEFITLLPEAVAF